MVQKTSTVYTTANYILYSAHSRFTDPPCNDTNINGNQVETMAKMCWV